MDADRHGGDAALSIHNTQLLLFAASPDRLIVYTDPARALAVLDPTGRLRVISCGVADEVASVAIRAAGYTVNLKLLPDADDPGHLADLDVGTPEMATEDQRRLLAAGERPHPARRLSPTGGPARCLRRSNHWRGRERAGNFREWASLRRA